jgi:hypothetical protein
MAVASRLRGPVIVLLAMLILAAVAVGRTGQDQRSLILRLHDLPPGYLNPNLQEGEDKEILCEALTHPQGTPAKLGEVVDRFHPKGCIAAYYRLFEIPGEEPTAAAVGTGAMELRTEAAADAVWRVVPLLLGRLQGGQAPHEIGTKVRIGRRTRLFHGSGSAQPGSQTGHRETFLVWRTRRVLGAILVSSHSFSGSDEIAAVLARRQQAHIDKPTPYTRAERFDGDVPLNDPALDLPVYWLGMNFKPGHGLASNRFFDGYAPKPNQQTGESEIGLEEAPGSVIRLRYYNFPIDSWTEATWPLYLRAKVSRVLTTWHCTEERVVQLPSGSATIYSGYRKNYGSCPDRPPTAFTAWVEIGGMHVVVNSPWCSTCILHTPYDSFKGMEAIVRALKLRQKPVY